MNIEQLDEITKVLQGNTPNLRKEIFKKFFDIDDYNSYIIIVPSGMLCAENWIIEDKYCQVPVALSTKIDVSLRPYNKI